MTTNNFFKSTLPFLYNITQNNAILYPKELVVATLGIVFLMIFILEQLVMFSATRSLLNSSISTNRRFPARQHHNPPPYHRKLSL